jgi:hypothetical protein
MTLDFPQEVLSDESGKGTHFAAHKLPQCRQLSVVSGQ